MESSSDRVRRAWEIVADLAVRGAPADRAVADLAALGADAVDALEDAAGLDDARVVDAAIDALAAIAAKQVRAAIAPLLNTAERLAAHPRRCARCLDGASKALQPRDAERLRPLVHRFAHHIDASVRAASARVAARLEDPALADVLDMLMRDPTREVVEAALAARAAIGASAAAPVPPIDAVPEIRFGLSSADDAARESAIARIVSDPAWRALIPRLLRETEGIARIGVLEACARLDDPGLAHDLFALALDFSTTEHDRALALRALAPGPNLDRDTLDAALERFAQSRDPFVRGHAGAVAVRAATRRSLNVAGWLLADPVPWVREAVAGRWAMHADRARALLLDRVLGLLGAVDPGRVAGDQVEYCALLLEGVARAAGAGVFIDSAAANVCARWLLASHGRLAEAARRTVDALAGLRNVVAPVDAVRAALRSDAPTERARGIRLAKQLDEDALNALETELIDLVRTTDGEVLAALAAPVGRLRSTRGREAAAWIAARIAPTSATPGAGE